MASNIYVSCWNFQANTTKAIIMPVTMLSALCKTKNALMSGINTVANLIKIYPLLPTTALYWRMLCDMHHTS